MKTMYEAIPGINTVVEIPVIKETKNTVTIYTATQTYTRYKYNSYSHIFNTLQEAKEYLLDKCINEINTLYVSLKNKHNDLKQLLKIKENANENKNK